MKSDLLPEDAERDFTASAYVVKEEEVLLIHHKKIGKVIQPGGHVEHDELPHQTARREVKEETGYNVEIQGDIEERAGSYDLPEPYNVNLHKIEDGHWHCDFAYLAGVIGKSAASHSEEHEGKIWLGKDELYEYKSQIPGNVFRTALEILVNLSD